MKNQLDKFIGVGTVFISDVINISRFAEQITVPELVDFFKRHLSYVSKIIEKHAGIILRWEGDTVLAFWHPQHRNPSHAQLAFNASCEILSMLPGFDTLRTHLTYDVDITLGTGDMAGDFFGPGKIFQVVGEVMAIADRLSRARKIHGSSIRMSQYTLELINPREGIIESGTISRSNLESLKVFTYNPTNRK